MNTFTADAFAMPSAYLLPNGSHVYLAERNGRKRAWENHGRGPSDPGSRERVATTEVCDDWIMKFVPPGSQCDECGITFLVNGVCQTYANRELLLANRSADVRDAAKNEFVVFFFGKYGFGLDHLKDLLRKSHRELGGERTALEKSLSRIDDCVDDELLAWSKVLKAITTLPVDQVISRGGNDLKRVAREKHRALIQTRESLYEQFRNDRRQLHREIFNSTESYCTEGLRLLAEYGYIDAGKIETHQGEIRNFLDKLREALHVQREHFVTTGTLNHGLAHELGFALP